MQRTMEGTSPRPRGDAGADGVDVEAWSGAGANLRSAMRELERVREQLQPSAALRAVLDEALTLCRRSLEELGRLPSRPAAPPGAGGPARGSELRRLTPREREVVCHAAQGRNNGAIGALLGISARTVETHRTKAMQKLGLGSLVELVHYAVRERLVEP